MSWYHEKKLASNILFVALFVVLMMGFGSALQETPISYIQKITYEPHCGTTCQNISKIINNVSVEYENCTTTCNPIFEIGLMFAGESSFDSITIDTAQDLYQNGSDFIIPGTYLATLGNTSDVTGLNDKIINLTSTVNKNLAQCYKDNIGLEQNHSKDMVACTTEKTSCDVALSQRNTKINEMEKYKGQRWWFALLGVGLGVFIIKWFIPFTQEHKPRRDPVETQHSPYTSHK